MLFSFTIADKEQTFECDVDDQWEDIFYSSNSNTKWPVKLIVALSIIAKTNDTASLSCGQ